MRDLAVVCDANKSDQTQCARLLRDMGFDVRIVENALDCDWAARTQNPAMIVISVDALWGGVDGIRDCLHERCGDEPVPLLLVMGPAPIEVLSRTSLIPATQCLQKPLSSVSVAQAIGTSWLSEVDTEPAS